MPYDFKIEMETYGDITDKVSSFTITDSIDQYARELSMNIADAQFYNSFDFSAITRSGEVEVFTKIHDTWVSQGTFFVERPQLSHEKDREHMQGVWGRSKTAKLGPPFAGKVSKEWDSDTSFYSICQEMCDLGGITWDSSLSEIADFKIYKDTYSVEYMYPIDVIVELATLAGGKVVTDKDDNLRIVQYQYSNPTNPLWEVVDDDIQRLIGNPAWPEFGNRIRISPLGSVAGYTINLYWPDGNCLAADGQTTRKIVGQVLDSVGWGVNNVIVDWSHDGHVSFTRDDQTLTQQIMISHELIQATSQVEFNTALVPSSGENGILYVYDYDDKGRSKNYAKDGIGVSYDINGRTITLSGEKFPYCDSILDVTYLADGCTFNKVMAGSIAEDVVITAEVDGSDARTDLYIGNHCQCPMDIMITAAPISIFQGTVSHILVYVEDSGPVTVARPIYMSAGSEGDRKGKLEWEVGTLSQVRIIYEKAIVRNDQAGNSTIELSMYPQASGVPAAGNGGIYVYVDDGTGEPDLTTNYYQSRDEKTITLNTVLTTGTEVYVDYEAIGAAMNRYYGDCVGSEDIAAFVQGTRREPFSTVMRIEIKGATECDPQSVVDESVSGGSPAGFPTGGFTVPAKGFRGPATNTLQQPVNEVKIRQGYTAGAGVPTYPKTGTAKVAFAWQPTNQTSITETPEGTPEHVTSLCVGEMPDWPANALYSYPGSLRATALFPKHYSPQRRAGCTIRDDLCGDEFFCCEQNGVLGCNSYENCEKVPSNCCTYVDRLLNPNDGEEQLLRFEDAIGAGCTCEEICTLEVLKFGTTQNYDNGSMRTIAQICIETYGLTQGTEAYNNKHAELLADALSTCEAQCDCSGVIQYTTLEMDINEQQNLQVTNPTYDTRRYSWEILRGGGTLIGSGTSAVYTAPSSNEDCEQNPTIALRCDGKIIDQIYITVSDLNDDTEAYQIIEAVPFEDGPGGECWTSSANWSTVWASCFNGSITNLCSVDPPFEEFIRKVTSYGCNGSKRFCTASQNSACSDHATCGGGCSHECLADPGILDLRSEAMKKAGCCPYELMI